MENKVDLLNAFEAQVRLCERLTHDPDWNLDKAIDAGIELRVLKDKILKRMDK